jgi:Xaa-Pro aminopeptidase
MTADVKELRSRWLRVRKVMKERDLDAVIAVGLSRDEILSGQQRWMTGFIARGGPAAVILTKDGVEIFYGRWSSLVKEFYKSNFGSEVNLVDGVAPATIADRVAKLGLRRIGIGESESFSAALSQAIGAGVEQIDVSNDMMRLRWIKSPLEIELIRKSCAISDTVWEQVPDICRIGRWVYEAVADVDQLVKREGAEGGFNVIMPVPFVGSPISSLVVREKFEAGSRWAVEVSPRYDGYYSQLTIPLTAVPNDDVFLKAYDDLVAAKQMAQGMMKPGANMTDVGKAVEKYLVERGHTMPGPSLGHFCGMSLEEPRHLMSVPYILEENMTMIFHPDCGGAPFTRFMRADTYLITKDGAENMNHYKGGIAQMR